MTFWNNLVLLQVAAVASAFVLTVGAILEYSHQLKLLALLAARWIRRKSKPFDRCVFKKLLLHSFGPILVVLGIAGEVIFEGRTFVVEDEQSAQEIDKRLALEKELVQQGPRYVLFGGIAGRQFRAALRDFSGQKIDLKTAKSSIDNPEVRTLKTLLFAILSHPLPSGPKWSVTQSETDFVSPEVMVGRSGQATEGTKAAAIGLAKALGDIGLSDVNGRIPPPIEIWSAGTGPQPDTVWLLIGAHMVINTKALDGSQ